MAKPCGFAIEFNPVGTPPLSLIPPPAMARPAQVRTMGWRVPRSERGLGKAVEVCHTAPPLGGLVQAAVRPGAVLRRLRARPSEACTHLCAEPEHVVGVWDGAGVGNPAGGASARRGLMAQSERLLRLVWAAVTESHTRWELLRL